ncbi:hypothetical protein [Pedobacter sp.]|uniref:hypothetical protein n=1 Tax=Pedobacter sp. TaxID=1411316 RepID=UPI003D7F1CD4
MEDASKEYYAAVIIHEAIHAYFRTHSGNDEEIEGMDHERMAINCIDPTAHFLKELYGISYVDASALEWRTVMQNDAYQVATNFQVYDGSNVVS